MLFAPKKAKTQSKNANKTEIFFIIKRKFSNNLENLLKFHSFRGIL